MGGDGSLGTLKRAASGEPQAELLRAEGLLLTGNSLAHCLDKVFLPAAGLNSGVKKQVRPPDAPRASPAKRRRTR